MEDKEKLTQEQKTKVIEIIKAIIDWGISGLCIVGGVILMILQSVNDINYPHGLIAGVITLSFGVVLFTVDRITYVIKKKIKWSSKGEKQ